MTSDMKAVDFLDAAETLERDKNCDKNFELKY